jgi:hypothetical protein
MMRRGDGRVQAIARFPIVTGHTLNERPLMLPQDFEGDIQIVVIAFERWQYRLMAEWQMRLQPLARDRVKLYELAVMRPSYSLMRKFIADRMRDGITDVAARAGMITLYTDLTSFTDALHIPNTVSTHVVLLDGDGIVRWQAHGQYTPQRHADLASAMTALPALV